MIRPLALLLLLAPTGLAQSLDDPRLLVETWAGDVNRPTGMAFVGPEELLVFVNTAGRVLRVKDGVVQNTALDLVVADRGGLGITTHPDFASNGLVYLYYTATLGAEGGAWFESRLVRSIFDGTNLSTPSTPLFTVPFDPSVSNANDHNSGTLRFGPDGMLYGQVGDKQRGRIFNGRIEQNTGAALSARAGGLFRLAPDGGIPVDNPFALEPNATLRPWYVYGFRNSLGMDFDPRTGRLWFGENGPDVYDEVNLAVPGMNSGWLLVMGPDARDATYVENGGTSYDASDLVMLPGAVYRDPELSFLTPIGITSLCFLDSKRFPADLRDVLLVAESNNGQLYRLDLDPARTGLVLTGGLADGVADDDTERDSLRFGLGFGRITGMRVGPDGYLYLSDYDGARILRLRPLVDLYEPAALQVLRGAVTSGGLEELELSDDERLRLGPAGPPGVAELRVLELEFHLNGPFPARLDVEVESRASRAVGEQVIDVWHVPTSSWQELDERPLSRRDTVVRVEDLPFPAEFVDPAGNVVRLRILQRSPDRALRYLFGTAWPPLTSALDLARLEVTWP